MARVRISTPAQADLENILAASLERWGPEGRRRYAALLTRAFRIAAARPRGPLTRDRGELLPGLRSLHLRHARGARGAASVATPVHVVYYRNAEPRVIEIVRVLHERMDPALRR